MLLVHFYERSTIVINNIPEFETPYHLIDIEQLERNLSILQNLKAHTNCKILYALKAFSNNLLFKYIRIGAVEGNVLGE